VDHFYSVDWISFLALSPPGACEHPSGGSIFVVNLFLDWTFVGWVIARLRGYEE
jgi:hypothetical protein